MTTIGQSLGRVDDFPKFGVMEIETNGRKILLAKLETCVSAVDAVCSHAGGPLVKGLLLGDKIVCPWHKAAFSVKTGRCLEPPAVDDLTAFPVQLIDGEIQIASPAEHSVAPVKEADDRCFVIIGAGAAGFSAAQTLRAEAFTGRILLIDSLPELPYDRTILSKYVMAGVKAEEKSPLQGDSYYREQAIERRSSRVKSLDVTAKEISFDGGETQTYSALLIATGSFPQDIPFSGSQLRGVSSLRTKADAERIVKAAMHSQAAVIIGTSFIGMEVAAGLRERGLQVTVIGRETVPFEKQLGPEVGAVFQRLHEEKGVQFRLGCEISELEGSTDVEAVRLTTGERIPAELVITGLGVSPATGFVEPSLLREDGGFDVDAGMKVVDGVYAAGDIAAFPLYGNGARIRVEHWRVAEQHGRVAAQNMLGKQNTFNGAPYFWTIQYKKRLDYVGHASGSDEVIVRGDLSHDNFIAYYLRDGTVKAAAGLNRDLEMAAIIELISTRNNWKVDELHPVDGSPLDLLNRD